MRQKLTAWLVVTLTIAIGYNSALAGDGGWGFGRHFQSVCGHRGNYSSFSLGYYSPGFGPNFYDGFYPNYGRFGGFDPYYSYPPAVVTVPVPVTPPVYIQQSPPVSQHLQAGYWYYCRNPEGYYPYIKECLQAWEQVEPRPPVNH